MLHDLYVVWGISAVLGVIIAAVLWQGHAKTGGAPPCGTVVTWAAIATLVALALLVAFSGLNLRSGKRVLEFGSMVLLGGLVFALPVAIVIRILGALGWGGQSRWLAVPLAAVVGGVAIIEVANRGWEQRSAGRFTQARERAGYANMRVIASALEMYEMDEKLPLLSAPGPVPLPVLLQHGQLKSLLKCEEMERSKHPEANYFADFVGGSPLNVSQQVGARAEVVIRCPLHGTVE